MAKYGEPIDLTNPTISLIEKGHRSVTERTIKALEREYNVNPNWLRTGEGEKYIEKRQFKDNFAGLTGKLMRDLVNGDDENAEIKEKIITEMLKLPDSHWDVIKDIFNNVAAEMNKKKDED